jgi:hypothetical protein
MKLVFLAMCSLIFISCATSPVSLENARKVELKSSSRYARPTNINNALITVIRDSGLGGSVCSVDVLINKHIIASIETAEYIKLFVKPGRYYLGAEHQCQKKLVEEDIEVKKNQNLKFRIKIGGEKKIQLIQKM